MGVHTRIPLQRYLRVLWRINTAAGCMPQHAQAGITAEYVNVSHRRLARAAYERQSPDNVATVVVDLHRDGGSRGIYHLPEDGQPHSAADLASAATWRAPVVVGGRTGQAYELLERVSELPRDQRFRQIYPRSTSAAGSILSSRRTAEGLCALPGRILAAAGTIDDSDPQSSTSAKGSLPTLTHRGGSGSQQIREAHGVTPPPPTRLAVLRQSLATAITQLWPWGRGPQAAPDSAATCPAHLHGDGWEGRQLARAHAELYKVWVLCACKVTGVVLQAELYLRSSIPVLTKVGMDRMVWLTGGTPSAWSQPFRFCCL